MKNWILSMNLSEAIVCFIVIALASSGITYYVDDIRHVDMRYSIRGGAIGPIDTVYIHDTIPLTSQQIKYYYYHKMRLRYEGISDSCDRVARNHFDEYDLFQKDNALKLEMAYDSVRELYLDSEFTYEVNK